MKLPQIKFKFSYLITPVLILVILIEMYYVYSLLYTNLDPQPTEVVLNKIVRVDLNAYQEITDLIKSKVDFAPSLTGLTNPNPFKYNQ